MADCSSTIDPDVLAGQIGDLPRATDRVRLVGLDHVARVQQARVGASERRLALVQARRPDESEEIARTQTALAVEKLAQSSFMLAVGTAEIDAPKRTPGTAVIHGRVIAADGTPSAGLAVAAVDANGSVRRYTCTDAKGYFLMSLPLGDQRAAVVYLQVSDSNQAVLYRGEEAIALVDQGVSYRVIQIGAVRRDPCPQPPERAVMPDLLGRPEASAVGVLGRLGLKVGQRLTQRDPEGAGLVVSQTPAAGEPIDANTSVTFVIGTADPADTTAVPDVVGLARDEAEAKLKEAGLVVGEILPRPGDKAGGVLSQDPVAGVRVAPGTAVSLVVAVQAPDDRVAVPDLVGQKLEAADRLLADADLVRGEVELREDDRAGLVLDQKPPAKAPVAKGSAVDVVVGRRSDIERTTVPDLVGSTLGEAKAILEKSRLQLGEVTGPANGRVVEHKPAAGSTAPVGSAVAVTLALVNRSGGFGAKFATAVTEDLGFAKLGLDEKTVRARLVAAAGSPDTAQNLATLPDTELQTMFEIKNRKQARDFQRMLKAGLKQL
ncbi:PASTA domain-containing protein [Sphingomonas sp. BIUV-7]|uniref:PASTA domain-containing protein n=1 Tax=Sphingomonas natans TaxID=3063330 RepID=A0ABT8YDV5_9SPHN|nr:PASTA domain-containing protein [Sphingomonas sp. BIUV-7]MDO6416127.1 PASTA domain-containing protein [Sphingomonas sp. BIUV-7]